MNKMNYYFSPNLKIVDVKIYLIMLLHLTNAAVIIIPDMKRFLLSFLVETKLLTKDITTDLNIVSQQLYHVASSITE